MKVLVLFLFFCLTFVGKHVFRKEFQKKSVSSLSDLPQIVEGWFIWFIGLPLCDITKALSREVCGF